MKKFPVVFVLYPGITQLDFTAPFEVFSRLPGAECVLASPKGGALDVGQGMVFSALTPLADVVDCELLCVSGGYGTVDMLRNSEFLEHLWRLGGQARYITSVCTGSLLLAAAGLLDGKRAACHWAWRDLLGRFSAIPDAARVVRDGNVISGGGVTAGLDMALSVAAEIAGLDFAEGLQLALEYAPQPPFDSGRPELARPEVLNVVKERLDKLRIARESAVNSRAQV